MGSTWMRLSLYKNSSGSGKGAKKRHSRIDLTAVGVT